MTKIHNFEKVRNIIKLSERDAFTNYDIVKETGMHYDQVKRILNTLVELGELKYSETSKIYVKNYED